MAGPDDDSDKTEEPTQRKLEQAHEQGDVIKSMEVGTFFGLVAVTAVVGLTGSGMTGILVPSLRGLVEHAADISVDGGGLRCMLFGQDAGAVTLCGCLCHGSVGLELWAAAFRQSRPRVLARSLRRRVRCFPPWRTGRSLRPQSCRWSFRRTRCGHAWARPPRHGGGRRPGSKWTGCPGA